MVIPVSIILHGDLIYFLISYKHNFKILHSPDYSTLQILFYFCPFLFSLFFQFCYYFLSFRSLDVLLDRNQIFAILETSDSCHILPQKLYFSSFSMRGL